MLLGLLHCSCEWGLLQVRATSVGGWHLLHLGAGASAHVISGQLAARPHFCRVFFVNIRRLPASLELRVSA